MSRTKYNFCNFLFLQNKNKSCNFPNYNRAGRPNASVPERSEIKFYTCNWDFIFHILAARMPGPPYTAPLLPDPKALARRIVRG